MPRLRKIIYLLCFLAGFLVFAGPALAGVTYQVQPRDSLFLIGKQFGLGVGDIKQANSLVDDYIYPGQALWLPVPDNNKAAGASNDVYTVRPGDTLFLIAQSLGITVNELTQANNLTSTMIYPGQTLRLPSDRHLPQNSSRSANSSLSRADLLLLARAVYGEARGEIYEGQVAVAAVVLNRLRHPDFPKTISGVLYQPWAFTSIYDGQFYLAPNATATRAAQDAVNGWDPSKGALYFWNPVTATSNWIWTRQIIRTIGNHIFAK